MDKLGRIYSLEVEAYGSGEIITIALPFTVEFDITRNTLTSANVCQIRIYNLSLITRNKLHRSVTNFGPPFQAVRFKAGYGENPGKVFTGNISQCWSVREGVNFITQIECFDGGFAFVNGETNRQFASGTLQRDVIKSLASTLPFISVGSIGAFPGTLSRANSYSGNTAQILSQLTGGGFFIDSGKANALGTDEYIDDGGTLTINAQSGLLGTPVLEQSIIHFDMLFEPSLNVGRKVKIDSITNERINGEYKVTAVKHRGMISESVCGSAITTGQFSVFKQPQGVPA